MDQINAQRARVESDVNSTVALLLGRMHLQIVTLEAQLAANAREMEMLRKAVGTAPAPEAVKP